MSGALDAPAPVLERIVRASLRGLFGLGLVGLEQSKAPAATRSGASSLGALSFVAASLVEAGQMLAFPFSAVQHIWNGTIIGSIVSPLLTVVMPASADIWFGPVFYQVRIAERCALPSPLPWADGGPEARWAAESFAGRRACRVQPRGSVWNEKLPSLRDQSNAPLPCVHSRR